MEIKNVRQIGKIENSMRVYEEDYVKSYIRQIAADKNTEKVYIVLVGHYIRQSEDNTANTFENASSDTDIEKRTEPGVGSLYIHGAIEVFPEIKEEMLDFNEKVWTEIYEKMKKYFPDSEIAGWCCIGNIDENDINGILKNTHKSNFSGKDKVFIKFDVFEGEEEIFYLEYEELKPFAGYFVYYEKNEQMQEYMLDNPKKNAALEQFEDRAVKEFREIVKRKEEEKKENVQTRQAALRNFYLAGAALVMVVIAVGATALNSSRRVNGLEKTIADLENTMSTDKNAQGSIFDEPAKDVLLQNEDTEKKDDSSADNGQDGSKTNKENEQDTSTGKEGDNINNAREKDTGNIDGDKTGSNTASEDKDGTGKGGSEENSSAEKSEGEENSSAGKSGSEENSSAGKDESEENSGAKTEDYTGKEIESNTAKSEEGSENNLDGTDKADVENQQKESENGSEENNETEVSNDENAEEHTEEKDEASKETAADNVNYKIYIVQAGDTLAGISYKLYGTIKKTEMLQEINDIQNQDRIYIGQEILYPEK